MSLISQTTILEAGGWGNTKTTFEHEGSMWNEIYFDMNGLNFQASIPNYSGASLQNATASLKGHINEEIGYVILTSINANFTPPKTAEEFV